MSGPTPNGSAIYAGSDAVKTGRSFEVDEWGNVIETRVFMRKGNTVAEVTGINGTLSLDDMNVDTVRNIVSRTATFDELSQVTEIQEKRIIKYADATRKRVSVEAQSGTENITAHPRFQTLAGTPDAPLEANALWIASNDAEGTKKFVEFIKPGLVGVSSYIAGTGSTLKMTYFDTFTNFLSKFDDFGTISIPDITNIWGTTTSWLLAGATAEPFGTRWKITLLYKNASENFGQYENGGWSPQIYT